MTWRKRRILSYLMHDFDDYCLPYTEIKMSNKQLVDTVVDFFNNGSKLIYPAKAYFVAIVYAKMLEKHFNIPFYEGLSQDALLIEDKWFIPHKKSQDTYDAIIKQIPEDFLTLKSTKKTRQYFSEEFLIGINS